MKKGSPPEEKGETAPLWIISFADMISLLMAFFVMLLTMASAKSGKLCNEGTGIFEKTLGGFKSSIAGYGMPSLLGTEKGGDNFNFDSEKAYYGISGGDSNSADRTIDAREEKIRRSFNQLSRHAKVFKSQVKGSRPDFVVIPIKFEPHASSLDDAGKEYLNKFFASLEQSVASEEISIYVVGLAGDAANEKERWMLSAKRAEAVSSYLRAAASAGKWHIYQWGAGNGGDWVKEDSAASNQSQILIAVLRGRSSR